MYIKRYSVAAFVLMALVGWFVYTYLTHESMSIALYGIETPSLSIAVLVVIPLFVLYIASVIHMSFYTLLNSLKNRKSEKDYEKLFTSIADAYLGKTDRKHKFKTPTFELFGKLLDNSTVFPNANINLDGDDENSKKLNKVLKLIESVKNGEVVELKSFGLSRINPLFIQNQRNMYKKGALKTEEILNHSAKYTKDLCKEVYGDFVKTASVSDIEKFKEFLTKDSLIVLMSRVNADENTLEMSNESLISIMSSLDLDTNDYITVSKAVSHSMIPDQRIKLFETLSNDKEEVTNAYLYTLFDLEMLDPAYALLEISQPQEYKNFKAYQALRECGQNFSIELFI